MEIEALRKAGLTEGESRVYLALLKLGPTTTGPLIGLSDVTKSFIYRILDKLIKKGLVSYVIKEKTKYFQAAPPTTLLDYMNKRKRDIYNLPAGFG